MASETVLIATIVPIVTIASLLIGLVICIRQRRVQCSYDPRWRKTQFERTTPSRTPSKRGLIPGDDMSDEY